jgi:hypothetical protein
LVRVSPEELLLDMKIKSNFINLKHFFYDRVHISEIQEELIYVTVQYDVCIQVAVFWVVTQCSDVVGYKLFRGPYSLHLEAEEGSVRSTSLHGVTTQKTATWIFNVIGTLNLA